MLYKVRSLGLQGISGYEVTAECDLASGLPNFDIVGLPDTAVKEARERVRSAIKNNGYPFPVGRITVNLAPANLRKSGTIYDLPICVGILAASGQLTWSDPHCAFVGELSLSGSLRPVVGMLPMALAARDAGIQRLFVPADSAPEATLAEGLTVYPVETVEQLAAHLTGQSPITPAPPWSGAPDALPLPDFAEVRGQEPVKRALEIAAAGGHNLLMVGPPGSGKSMLARRFPSILPPLSQREALEATQIHSVMGLTTKERPLLTQRPFRAPHHTISAGGMAGGGNPYPRPGEISLAHHGVLFLDELPEFHKDVIEVLRQPMEEGVISVVRSAASETYPCDFTLLCAMNPCKCGWYGHPSGRCTCSDREVARYVEKISGPLLDRIDLHVSVPAVEYASMRRKETPESSADVKCRVDAARAVQTARFAGTGVTCNAHMTAHMIGQFCCLDHAGDALMKSAFERMGLTARSHDRILRVARTIADLAGSESIRPEHIAEAVQYRSFQLGGENAR